MCTLNPCKGQGPAPAHIFFTKDNRIEAIFIYRYLRYYESTLILRLDLMLPPYIICHATVMTFGTYNRKYLYCITKTIHYH